MNKFIYKKFAEVTALSASFSDFEYKKHSHKEYALGVTLRGIQQFNLNGSLQSSYQNGVMLFNLEQLHDGRAKDRTGIDYIMIYIEPELFLEMLGKRELVQFSTPIVYNYKLEEIILKLSSAIFNGKNEVLCSELLLSLADNIAETNIYVNYRKEDTFMKKAKEMIHCSLGTVLSLDEICKELNMSKFQFIRIFNANMGISPYQYFLNCKVERAKELIEKNSDIYSAVAECGYVDLTHLNKHFKSIYGTTAFQYIEYLNIHGR